MKTKKLLVALILCAGIATAAVTTERYTVYVTRTVGGRQMEIVHDVYTSSAEAIRAFRWLRSRGLAVRIVAEVSEKD
jgi:hypothetical protein